VQNTIFFTADELCHDYSVFKEFYGRVFITWRRDFIIAPRAFQENKHWQIVLLNQVVKC
jgi:hypothetical protein